MKGSDRLGFALVAALLALALGALPALAAEVRLAVASLHDDAIHAYLEPGEQQDGAAGPGLERLLASLDAGALPTGVMLWDRPLTPMPEARARGYGASPIPSPVRRGGEGRQRWDEVAFEGRPGQQSVWVVALDARRPQELQRAILKGAAPARHFTPYAPVDGRRYALLRYPLAFLWAGEERGDLWATHLVGALDLAAGVAVVMGVNHDRFSADHAYVVVRHGDRPASYKVVLGWRQSPLDRDAPGPLERRRRR
jgi:hypothetical protein